MSTIKVIVPPLGYKEAVGQPCDYCGSSADDFIAGEPIQTVEEDFSHSAIVYICTKCRKAVHVIAKFLHLVPVNENTKKLGKEVCELHLMKKLAIATSKEEAMETSRDHVMSMFKLEGFI